MSVSGVSLVLRAVTSVESEGRKGRYLLEPSTGMILEVLSVSVEFTTAMAARPDISADRYFEAHLRMSEGTHATKARKLRIRRGRGG